MPKRFTFEGNNGAWTVQYDQLGPVIALAKSLQQTHQPYRIFTADAEGETFPDGSRTWHDGLTEAERETLTEAGVL